jgi:hypothetical protein
MEHGRWWGVVATWLGVHGSPNTAGLAAASMLRHLSAGSDYGAATVIGSRCRVALYVLAL